jgi:hypothetical protein
MKKELVNYLHLYLGCECQPVDRTISGRLLAIRIMDGCENAFIEYTGQSNLIPFKMHELRPILRLLSDMTEDEMKELLCFKYAPSDYVFRNMLNEFKFYCDEPKRNTTRGEGVGYSVFKDGSHYQSGTLSFVRLNPTQFHYLLSLHFDLFDLIPSGLAIDASTITSKS